MHHESSEMENFSFGYEHSTVSLVFLHYYTKRGGPVIENIYFHYNIILQNLLRLKMSIIVLLLPSYFFLFVLPRIMIYKSKTTIFSLENDMIITSLFWKLTEVSTNNLKTDIKRTSDRIKMCKNSISV